MLKKKQSNSLSLLKRQYPRNMTIVVCDPRKNITS